MKRTALRITLICSLAVAFGAVAVPVALADTAITQSATSVTPTSAVLHGTLNSGGKAGFYQFQYGTTTKYTKATPLQVVGTGSQNQNVSAKVKNLKPHTLYHFRVVLITRGGPYYYANQITRGSDRTFRTQSTGRLVLLSRYLIVTKGHLMAILQCASSLRCKGTYSVTTRARIAHSHRFGTIVCTKPGSATFNIPAHQTRTVSAKATGACVSLLRHARHQQLKGKFSSRPRSGQQGVITPVRLILV